MLNALCLGFLWNFKFLIHTKKKGIFVRLFMWEVDTTSRQGWVLDVQNIFWMGWLEQNWGELYPWFWIEFIIQSIQVLFVALFMFVVHQPSKHGCFWMSKTCFRWKWWEKNQSRVMDGITIKNRETSVMLVYIWNSSYDMNDCNF